MCDWKKDSPAYAAGQKPLTVISPEPHNDALAFIQKLVELSCHRFPNNHSKQPLMFRGVDDADHRLVPAALRSKDEDPKAYQLLRSIGRFEGLDLDNSEREDVQRLTELSVLQEFHNFADRAGLNLPPISREWRDALLSPMRQLDLITTDPANPRIPGDETANAQWPPDELLPILSLAQHYELPTRLLDWTFCPFTGIYFAASGAIKRLKRGDDKDALFGVWFLSTAEFDRSLGDRYGEWMPDKHPIRLIRPPTADNPNLRCQQGVLTVVLDCRNPFLEGGDAKVDRRSLDEILKVNSGASIGLVRIPLKEAPSVLSHLARLGFSSNRLFDGYAGAARAVKESADLLTFRSGSRTSEK